MKYGLRSGVYVGRPTKWGNPHRAEEMGRTLAIESYGRWLLTQPELLAALPELTGRHLVCHCAPLPCHADILVWLANGDIQANIEKLRAWSRQ